MAGLDDMPADTTSWFYQDCCTSNYAHWALLRSLHMWRLTCKITWNRHHAVKEDGDGRPPIAAL